MSDIDSIEVEVSADAVSEIRRLIIGYKTLFRDDPKAIALSPYGHLQLGITLMQHQRFPIGFDSENEIRVDGVPIVCKLNGPPEIIANPKHIKHIAWMREKDDKRLWPILTGS